jgi:hypothetical protein
VKRLTKTGGWLYRRYTQGNVPKYLETMENEEEEEMGNKLKEREINKQKVGT